MTEWARFVRPALHDLHAYHPGPSMAELEERYGRAVVRLNRNEDLFPPLAGVRELLASLKELRADTLVFTSDAEAAALSTRALMLPGEIDEMLAVIPYIIPAQLFAALLADAKDLDPDAPRSLAKVTRTL